MPHTKNKREEQARDDDRPVIAILPYDDRVATKTDLVFVLPVDTIVKEPATVAVPESFGGVVGIFFFIRLGMMADMVAAPFEGGIL